MAFSFAKEYSLIGLPQKICLVDTASYERILSEWAIRDIALGLPDAKQFWFDDLARDLKRFLPGVTPAELKSH